MRGVLTRLNTHGESARYSAGGSQRLQYRQYDESASPVRRPTTVDAVPRGRARMQTPGVTYASYDPPNTAPGFGGGGGGGGGTS
jgi:hypothetical protein